MKKEDKHYYELRYLLLENELTIDDIDVRDAVEIMKREPYLDNSEDRIIKLCTERINKEPHNTYWRNRATLETYAYANIIAKKLAVKEKLKKVKKVSLNIGGAFLVFVTIFTGSHAIGKASFGEFITALSNSFKKIVKLEFNVKDDRESNPIVVLKELPEGYSLLDYKRDDNVGYGILHLSDYKNDDNNIITYQVKIYENYSWNTEIETMGIMSSFEFEGSTYYEASNIDYNILFWYIENRLHIIQGDVPVETLRYILKKNF